MHSKWKCLVVPFLVLVLCWSGCGGGGGKPGPSDPGPEPPSTETSATFTVAAGQAVEKTVGNVGISIPANAFAQSATVTVELLPIAVHPTNQAVGTVGGDVQITSTVAPVSPVTIVGNGSSTRSSALYYLPASWIGGKWRKLGEATESMGKVRAAIDPKWFVATRSVRALINVVNTSFDNSIGLVFVAGDPSNQTEKVAILVHGIMSNEDAMKPLGQPLINKGYRSIWALHYAWQLPTTVVSPELGNYLVASNEADTFSHSRGGLITRYTLEILQKRPKTSFNQSVFICTPHKGSKLDLGVDFLTSLQEHFLNDPKAVGFPVANTPAVQELIAGSEVVQALNSHGCNTAWNIKYYLFATESDVFVGEESAQAHGVNMECFTGFPVVRRSLWGGHSTLISDPGCINNMLSFVQ